MSIVEIQQQQEANGNGSTNTCVLPQLRGRLCPCAPLRWNLLSFSGQSQRTSGRTDNDFLPQELMLALRQTSLPAEYLGPPGAASANRSLRPIPSVHHSSSDLLSLIESIGPSSRVRLVDPTTYGIIRSSARSTVSSWIRIHAHVEQASEFLTFLSSQSDRFLSLNQRYIIPLRSNHPFSSCSNTGFNEAVQSSAHARQECHSCSSHGHKPRPGSLSTLPILFNMEIHSSLGYRPRRIHHPARISRGEKRRRHTHRSFRRVHPCRSASAHSIPSLYLQKAHHTDRRPSQSCDCLSLLVTLTSAPMDHCGTCCSSRKPVGRAQVLKLKHTMDALLERVTMDDSDLGGQTQVRPERANSLVGFTIARCSCTIYSN